MCTEPCIIAAKKAMNDVERAEKKRTQERLEFHGLCADCLRF